MENLTTEKLDELFKVALELADAGGAALKNHWGKVGRVDDKSTKGDLVTEADRESERRIIKILQEKCPSHGILAEESGGHPGDQADFLWVVDPLDGTTNFAHKYPVVAVSIALLHKNNPVIGVVYNPITEEKFCAAKGKGATLNGISIKVSSVTKLDKSLLASGFPYDRRENSDNNSSEFLRLTMRTQGVRRGGSAALDLAYVAAGVLDGYWEKGIKIWDIAAGVLLVEEAGGAVTGYDGGQYDLSSGKVLASNGKIHSQLIDELLLECAEGRSV